MYQIVQFQTVSRLIPTLADSCSAKSSDLAGAGGVRRGGSPNNAAMRLCYRYRSLTHPHHSHMHLVFTNDKT